jgi:cysteine desulfurase
VLFRSCVKAYGATDLLINANGIVKGEGNFALQGANSETGICQGDQVRGAIMSDQVQTFGKLPISFNWLGIKSALLSAHKIGGPKGVGALVLSDGIDVSTQIKGGGQEQGRRSGTENLLGIVGFGVAAKVAAQDLANGVWEQVGELRDKMEIRIADTATNAIFFGKDVDRLPNTSNFAVPGWKGDTQVMKMDLSGFAISAGSACSSGKVKVSQVLKAMGYDDITASSAIRVSIGPTTTEQEVMSFADAWIKAYKKFVAKAA